MFRFHSLLAAAFLLAPLSAAAQSIETAAQSIEDNIEDAPAPVTADSVAADSIDALLALPIADKSSFGFAAPNFQLSAPGFYGFSPYYTMGNAWELHEGFNAQVSMSLTAAFGHHAPHGVGFGQSAAFAYAIPLNDRFAVAAGVYADNMTWGGRRFTDGGVAAAVRYRLSDAVNLYGYATKSFISDEARRHSLFPYYPAQLGDRIGAMAEFKIGEKAMIQVCIEQSKY